MNDRIVWHHRLRGSELLYLLRMGAFYAAFAAAFVFAGSIRGCDGP